MIKTIADRLFDATFAEFQLDQNFENAGLPDDAYERLSWDYYDRSLEMYGVPPDLRLTEAVQRVLYDAGFRIVYVNHTDGWETHYGFDQKKDFVPYDGWRKKHDGEHILVEKFPEGWPQKWFDSGYVKVVDNAQA